jgi:hypothetical protein
MFAAKQGIMPEWDGIDRRRTAIERRKEERRHSLRYTSEILVVLDNITWIDSEGTDRRRKIRRRADRERIAKRILEDFED